MATVQHHQTNGKAERFMRYLENSLALVIQEDQSDWDDMTDVCLFAYRTTMSQKLQETPFYLLYGRDPILPGDLILIPPANLIAPTQDNLTDAQRLIAYRYEMLKRFKHSKLFLVVLFLVGL